MAKLNNILNLFKIFLPFEDFLYLYQLVEYYPADYLKTLPRFFLKRNIQKRDYLKKTSFIKLILVVSLVFFFSSLIVVYIAAWPIFLKLFLLLFSFVLIPVFVLAGIIVTKPFQLIWNHYLYNKAAKKVKEINPKVIAITGSFGKTTVKNYLYQLVEHSYRVSMPEGNINTAEGIVNWIIKNLDKKTECLILEMGAYKRGEIKKSCLLAPPDIAIITSLGDQHLSRFGSFDNLVKTKTEIFKYAKKGAFKIIPSKYKKHLKRAYSGKTTSSLKDLNYLGEKLEAPADLSSYQLDNLKIALKVAEILKIPSRFVKDAVSHLKTPDRRSSLKQIHGYPVVDDSYNISLETGRRRVEEVLSLLKGKELVLVTAGIPESGLDSANVNQEYGEFLAQKVDHLIVIESLFSSDLVFGFQKGGGKSLVSGGQSHQEAWRKIKEFSPKEALVLLQPELTDLYY